MDRGRRGSIRHRSGLETAKKLTDSPNLTTFDSVTGADSPDLSGVFDLAVISPFVARRDPIR
jgi:hypothetical protein